MTTHLYDPLRLSHRVHIHASDDGYEARCVCGWSTCRPSREQRDEDTNAHLNVRRTIGSHGVVSEGD